MARIRAGDQGSLTLLILSGLAVNGGLVTLGHSTGTLTAVRKKTYNLDTELIERVRRLVNAKTETEAIHGALREAAENREIQRALEDILAQGKFRTVYR